MYRVRANVPFGIDDTLDCEYSGILHNSKAEAEEELKKAKEQVKNTDNINYVYIEEV